MNQFETAVVKEQVKMPMLTPGLVGLLLYSSFSQAKTAV
jgi:hypothetical protein